VIEQPWLPVRCLKLLLVDADSDTKTQRLVQSKQVIVRNIQSGPGPGVFFHPDARDNQDVFGFFTLESERYAFHRSAVQWTISTCLK
jgi:hypothetical protein